MLVDRLSSLVIRESSDFDETSNSDQECLAWSGFPMDKRDKVSKRLLNIYKLRKAKNLGYAQEYPIEHSKELKSIEIKPKMIPI